jgi:NTE family protein
MPTTASRARARGIHRALVLGAGGHAAFSWEIGLLAGLADAGVEVRSANRLVGTSAGARLAALLASGARLDELYAQQLEPGVPTPELPPPVDLTAWRAAFDAAKREASGPDDALRRIGALPAAAIVAGADRRESIASSLPERNWPEQHVMIAVVDADSADRRAFEAKSGVALADAVAASCALPGVWPPLAIDGHRYMDGGTYSIDNCDLATGCDRVLVLTLRERVPPFGVVSLDTTVSTLRETGARVEVVCPDAAAEDVFAARGNNVLDPAVRERAARAGRAQGCKEASRVASLWA